MNTFSVENRTRTYQSQRSFDNQFDCELPAEALEEIQSQKNRRQKTAPPPPPPPVQSAQIPPPAKREGRDAAIIAAVVIVIAFLYAVSHRGDPRVPLESRPLPTPVKPPPVEVRRALPSVEVRRAMPVEIRRALPAVPRALPVTSAVSSPVNNWQQIRFLDGTTVWASYQGELSSSAALPPQGRFIGEEWSTGNTSWIWMTPAGASFPSWVDP